MYSGIPITRYSGRIMGAHQKIDRIARRHLGELLTRPEHFPSTRSILQFEGKNGPDGIKVKSPAKDEPWHFLNPLSHEIEDYKTKSFQQLLEMHFRGLVKELKKNNHERSAFEAAWLSHAIVDGLTPAHHYPFEEKIAELRGGASNDSRTTYKKKLIFGGSNKRETAKNMFKAYGPRGLYMAHVLFEAGFSIIVRPLRFPDARPTQREIKRIRQLGPTEYFMRRAREVAVMELFEQYLEKGWTSKLARQIRQQLAPLIVRTVTIIWYEAAREALI